MRRRDGEVAKTHSVVKEIHASLCKLDNLVAWFTQLQRSEILFSEKYFLTRIWRFGQVAYIHYCV